ncbi:MAG: PrsW family intramembrane metalloprotease, partial [Candidatus Eremiobacteraeota bacterium]|nr:PrsW family intramembrane metalloprotease [Candidatus Eremiobacteraeota bacterium]
KSEPVSLLIITFVLGGILAIVAAFVEPALPAHAGTFTVFVYFLFGVGLIEEIAKFIAVRVWVYRSFHFDEAMDGVIFGITAALGFATVENLFYVFQYGGTIGIFRAFVSVPGHAFYGAMMGYYLGEAKVQKKWWLALVGLALATALHGLFDTLSQLSGIWGLLALPALTWAIYFFIVRKEIQKAQAESLYAPKPEASLEGTPSS